MVISHKLIKYLKMYKDIIKVALLATAYDLFASISIFRRVIAVKTYSPAECINSPTCRVESPTGLF